MARDILVDWRWVERRYKSVLGVTGADLVCVVCKIENRTNVRIIRRNLIK
jgi:hypothetical protein